MADLSRRQLGNYRLVRLIGTGGFADVYLGKHIYLDTSAAVKVLQARLINDQDREAFYIEARTIAHLNHQHIVRVLDFDVENDVPFLVTAYAPNGTLRERYPRQTHIPLPQIVAYVEQIAQALQYAHNHKIVHRDVKPENILLGSADEVLLSDFGISIIVQSSSAQLPEKLLGTGAYMAPEQFRGKAYPASDQYALAIMVYEWVCGERPFQGSFFDLYEHHQKTLPPPLSTKFSTVPLALEAVLMRALEKLPEQRFPSVADFAHALSRTIQQTQEHMPHTHATTDDIVREISPFAPTLLPSSPMTPPLQAKTSTSDLTLQQEAHFEPGEFEPLETLPPDTLLARAPVSLTQSTEHTRIAQPPQASISSMLPTQPIRIQKHSRRALLGRILVIGAASCVAGVFTEPYIARYIEQHSSALYTYHGHSATVWDVSWSPDSKRVASASKDMTVQVWDATSGGHVLPFRGHTSAVTAVAWSPSGNYLASGGDDDKVEIWDARSLVRSVTYLGHTAKVNALTWSPDGQLIASASADETVQIWKPVANSASATITKAMITYTGHVGAVNALAWSPDGKYLASASDDTTIQVWSASNGKLVYIYNGHTRAIHALAWSPDNRLLASGSDDTTIQVWHALNGTHITTYTGHASTLHSLAWSPNSKRIVSASDSPAQSSNSAAVQVWDATSGAHPYFYFGHSGSVTTVSWSASGQYIASGGNDSTVQVWKPA